MLDGAGKTAEQIALDAAQADRPTEHIAIAKYLAKQGAMVGKRIPHHFLEPRIVLPKAEKLEEQELDIDEIEEKEEEDITV